jgi:cation diffusion facilitator family transporter
VAEETRGTVLLALAANLVIALAKLVGGLLSGSSAMLAEAAHSVADSMNQVFLLASIKVSTRPADPEHPFGYGKARFFWSLLAAVGIFVAGAVFSIYEGVHSILSGGEQQGGLLVNYVVLAIAFAAEGASWLKAFTQVRGEARAAGRPLLEHVRTSKDPTVKTVLSEDSVAVLGLVFAAAGIGLHQLTGQAWWDGAAAIAIGILLAIVAFLLGRENAGLLIGEAAEPQLVLGVYETLGSQQEVDAVVELLTMHLGPESVLVAARLDFSDDLPASQIEEFATRIERELEQHWPEVTQVFLDPTRADRELAERTRRHFDEMRRRLSRPVAGRAGHSRRPGRAP